MNPIETTHGAGISLGRLFPSSASLTGEDSRSSPVRNAVRIELLLFHYSVVYLREYASNYNVSQKWTPLFSFKFCCTAISQVPN